MNTESSPTNAVVTKIDELIQAHLTLHITRTSSVVNVQRLSLLARHEADVQRRKAELAEALDAACRR